MSKKRAPEEPYWAPLPRQHFNTTQTISIVARHLIPLAGVLLFGWSPGQFVLLSVFNIAFTVACIGTVGVAVSTRKENGPSPNLADEIASWITLLGVGVFISLLLTAMFGWVIALFAAATSPHGLFDLSLAGSALLMVVSAAPGLFQQYQADMRSSMTEEERKKRDQPNVLVLVMCAGLIFIISGYIPDLGQYGLVIMAIAVTGLFIFRDLRPDLMRELTRPKNRPPQDDYKKELE